jgi:hypothetical protein
MHRGKTRDRGPLLVRQLYLDLADYQTSSGNFDDAIATLRSVMAEI